MERSFWLDTIHHRFKTHRILGLLGPRQCGKTTLARAYLETTEKIPRRNYFDLENPNDAERLKHPYQVLKELEGLIVIDEVQRAPNLFPILRVLHDEFPQKKFLILGNASKDLIQKSSESLTGRIYYEEITPFSFFETGEWKHLWFRGGFPRSYLASSDEESLEWREGYVRTLLEQDVPNLGFQIPALHLRRFWMLLAHCHGQIFNAHQLAQNLNLSPQSAKRYLDLLHDMLMVRVLAPWYENMGKRQVKSAKIYIRDSGIFHYLSHMGTQDAFALSLQRGHSFEGFVIEEIIRTLRLKSEDCFFWSTHSGAELDFLAFVKGKKIGFEIKLTDTPSLTKSMHIALHDLKLDHLYVIHPGDVSWPLNDQTTALCFSDIITLQKIFLENRPSNG